MSWRTAGSLLTLREMVDAAAPGRSRRSDGTIGDPAHAARTSDHNPNAAGVVRALDLTHDPANGADMDETSESLVASRDRRIKYLIRNGRICSSTVSPWIWRPYNGLNPHRTHLHVSVSNRASVYDRDHPWALPAAWQPFVINPQEAVLMEALIRGIQESLAEAGIDPGPLDGRWGPRTQGALTDAFTGSGGGQFTDSTAKWLNDFASARPADARGTSLWHVLSYYRQARNHFKVAP